MSDSRVDFCTCSSRDCPNHPANHDRGCTPCNRKNLKRGEIPSCFFNLIGHDEPLASYRIENFARLALMEEEKR